MSKLSETENQQFLSSAEVILLLGEWSNFTSLKVSYDQTKTEDGGGGGTANFPDLMHDI